MAMKDNSKKNPSRSPKKTYRKFIDPEVVAGTSFDGIQPGDIVQMTLYREQKIYKPVFVIDVDVRNENDMLAVIATKEEGIKTIHERDVQSMKVYGEQQTGVAKELRKYQAEWLKTKKTLEAVMKMLAPLLESRARASMRMKSVNDSIMSTLDNLSTEIHSGGNKRKHKK